MLEIGIIWLILSLSHIPDLIHYYLFRELKGVKSLTEEVFSAPPDFKEAAAIYSQKSVSDLCRLAKLSHSLRKTGECLYE